MNQQQIKYIRARADKIYSEKRRAINEQFKVAELTVAQKIAALEAGRFRVRPELVRNTYSWVDAVEFTDAPRADKTEQKRRLEQLQAQFTRLMDEIVLGDNEEALNLLRAFENA